MFDSWVPHFFLPALKRPDQSCIESDVKQCFFTVEVVYTLILSILVAGRATHRPRGLRADRPTDYLITLC